MGSTELAANLFRATQAEEKLRREKITGKDKANKAHRDVGAKVRQWKENRKLASWVSVQRQRRKQNQIADEEIRLLDLLGFTWKSRDVGTWEDRLQEIKDFKIKNGHCDVPLNLEQTGFKWNAQTNQNEDFWEKRCKQLLDYKQRHGHGNDYWNSGDGDEVLEAIGEAGEDLANVGDAEIVEAFDGGFQQHGRGGEILNFGF